MLLLSYSSPGLLQGHTVWASGANSADSGTGFTPPLVLGSLPRHGLRATGLQDSVG